MALTRTDLDAITQNNIQPIIADNIFNATVAWPRLWNQRRQYTGLSIRLPVEFQSNDTATAFTGTATRDLDNRQFITDAAYNLKEYSTTMTITDRQLAQNTGREAIASFMQATVNNATKSMADLLETDFWGTSSDDPNNQTLEGQTDILSTTTTLGGIAVADFSNWAAKIDSTTTTLTLRSILDNYQDISEGSNTPTVGHTTKATFAKFQSLLNTNQRFTMAGTAATAGKADVGFVAPSFLGIPILMSSFVPGTGGGTTDSFFALLNENFLMLFVSRQFAAQVAPWKDLKPERAQIATSIELKTAFGTNNRRFQGAQTTIDPAL